MKLLRINIRRLNTYKWIVLIGVIVMQLGTLAYVGWRWHNAGVDGIPYQWRCMPRLETAMFGTDYIRVIFPEDTTVWLDNKPPHDGNTVYIYIKSDNKGMLTIQGAAYNKPARGVDYIKAKIVSIRHKGKIQFKVPFDRYRMAPQMTDGIYQISSADSVIAQIRMKKGVGVIEGIFVNGIPLENISNGAIIEARKQAQQKNMPEKRLVESGMVPIGKH
ncbi:MULTISPECIES: hypothetical protein [Megasphaera]|jgi:hypothetical protein|uniref:Uncharacterized protein n=1 Tax=Megasphaera hutchinsoni TaxID=1588748 RepID=A0A134CLF4_9FIRM|nr:MULTISPECIES: hypothetical protein [Megasphaera]KXB93046.1 hypothetical protein HMPREF3182_00183 [Megasphaera hutchinsoni]MUP48962.1 hypothetical protein [Veillonellaceae bacterium M2-8]PNH21545.1 hypothetical protein CAL30_05750 [Megasphaera genomosp. type_2]